MDRESVQSFNEVGFTWDCGNVAGNEVIVEHPTYYVMIEELEVFGSYCDLGYRKIGSSCVANVCTCDNGSVAIGSDCRRHGSITCTG